MLRLWASPRASLAMSRTVSRRLSTLSSSSRPGYSYRPSLSSPHSIYRPFVAFGAASFHSSRRHQALPLIPLLVATLKASTALELARTAGRIVFTFAPVIFFKNHRSKKILHYANFDDQPEHQLTRKAIEARIRKRTKLLQFLLSIPIFIFWGTMVASMERTPITGRWRMIVLSPEEEDDIANQLAGPGWYSAVGEILAQDGPVECIAPSDWRYIWVRNTLRRLEATIPILMQERDMCPEWVDRCPPDDIPMPPPAEYPLRPRPRASEYIRSFCESMCKRHVSPVPHNIPGPPYSLLVIDRPESSNAFSYGFGPNGGGGIVIYSGFLDEILARRPPPHPPKPAESWWSTLLGVFAPAPAYHYPIVTEDQTTDLAILLSHELSHLILAHHLETLSSATVFIPGTLSIASDILRVIIFPFTMFFGPFVNDALAQFGKMGSGEFAKIGEYCTSMNQETEADVVSARLLAHAGFDARAAVEFWENRSMRNADCGHIDSTVQESTSESIARRILGSSHPGNEMRVEKLKAEIVRWEVERRAEVRRQQRTPLTSSVVLAAA